MAYLAPIHRPSSVRHAIKLSFLTPEEECLVVAKANRLEIYTQTQDGLSLQHSKAIYGKVTMLQKLRPVSSATDHLFVGTDRFMYFMLSWNTETKQLQTEKSFVDVADKSARDTQTGDRCLMDPSGRYLTLELFEGIITVVPIIQRGKKKRLESEIGTLGEPVPSRIPEMFVRSSAFLHQRSPQADKPKLALLYEDSHSKVRLKVRQIAYSPGAGTGDPGMVELEEVEGMKEELELGASHVLPVPEPAYGMLIVGETSISYVDDENHTTTRPLGEATIFVAWEMVDNQRFVLADEYGRLYLLMLLLDGNNRIHDWKVDIIGETSRASVLVYLDAGLIFVGSHQGDSQVIQITERSMDIVQTFANIAPILDFTIMDMGNRSGEGQSSEYSSGQARIVTGSGAFKDGSLRSVRSGVGLEDLGVLGEMEHVSNLFSLNSDPTSEDEDTLLVTFVDETRIFCFDTDGEVEEVDDFKGMILSETTHLARNLPQGRLLQVTESCTRVTDSDSGMVIAEWKASNGAITAASANDRYAVISMGGVGLTVLNIANGLQPHVEKHFGAESQVACVAVPSTIDKICFVGFWQDSLVSVFNIDTLEPITKVAVADESVPRSLLLTNIFPEQPPTLFIAMADGNVITYSMDETTYAFSDKKSIILGTQQANFYPLPRGDGLFNVFATCEHPSLIYGSEGRLVYSAVTAEKAVAVCPFNSASYPGAIAIATSEDLRIAMVDTERTTHVQTLVVNETVRRIAYSPTLKAFGMGTIKRTLKDGAEIIKSHFKLADEIMFKELDTFALNEDELIESLMRAELDDGSGDMAERFVVGTAYLDDDQTDARGRIIVLEVTEDRTLKLITELAVKGSCRCLAMVDGRILAALTKTVVVYSFEYASPSKPELIKKASYRTSTAPIDISVTGTTIAVADLMKSVSVVQYKRGEAGLPDTLTEIARHFQTTWGTAVAEVGENMYLESDAEGNLMVLYRDTNGVTEEDRRRLQVSSEMLLGEMVNRIRRIDVVTAPDAPVIPRAFLATVEGSLYLFALIAPSKQNLLMHLQSNLAECVQSPGHVPFNKYRAFKNQVREADEPNRFVDGDLIERFLDCTPEVQQKAVEGLGVDVEEVRGMVEVLRRLH